jgi:hypothetical protein
MILPAPRSGAERKADTLAKLSTKGIDVWVASAGSAHGVPVAHLVPFSLAWIDERIVIALEAEARTARNIQAQGIARLALGPTRDVVIIDARLEHACAVADALAALADGYANQADWDPRVVRGDYLYLTLRPERIQAWREANELTGRTLMRASRWLV